MKVIELMQVGPVIPVITIKDTQSAVPMARALLDGGVRVMEVTLRTPQAIDAIRAISQEVDGAIVGVGTISYPKDFQMAIDAGAQFGVSPGLTHELIAAANDTGLPLLPGVMTPSDVLTAVNAGFNELKLFPAAQAGGTGALKALSGPFPDVRFCPTGGIDVNSAAQYLALDNVVCVGGSWLTPAQSIADKDWPRISALARQAVELDSK